MVGRGKQFTGRTRRFGIGLAIATGVVALCSPSRAEDLAAALAKAYQTNPALNAERARQRGTDENVPQALAGYRPQLVATLGAGLQAVRNLLP
ncbi:MAG: transporter, partial [Bradyrhizobium sp.]|nr:transporter [Bradyrhizobium sp.]